MAFKIAITPGDKRRLLSQNRRPAVPPPQVHQNKKAYRRRSKHRLQEYD